MRCVLVDDDATALQLLHKLCGQFPEIQVVGECKSAEELVEFLLKQEVDVILLDIKMPGKTGMDIAKTLANPNIQVVFITGDSTHAVDAFSLNVTDYIQKPIKRERFAQSVVRMQERYSVIVEKKSKAPAITIRTAVSNVQIGIAEIVSVHSDRGWLKIKVIGGNEFLTYSNLSDFEAQLSNERFCRVHNRYIVNLNFVEEVFSNSLLIQGHEIPISRQRKKEFHDALKLHQSKKGVKASI